MTCDMEALRNVEEMYGSLRDDINGNWKKQVAFFFFDCAVA